MLAISITIFSMEQQNKIIFESNYETNISSEKEEFMQEIKKLKNYNFIKNK